MFLSIQLPSQSFKKSVKLSLHTVESHKKSSQLLKKSTPLLLEATANLAVTVAQAVAHMAALPAAEVPVLVEAVLEDMEVHKVEALWDPLEETAASVI